MAVGDLSQRGIDDALKAQLQENARLNGRSLSDEAIDQLRKSLASRDR
jgi:plasmid stability protein